MGELASITPTTTIITPPGAEDTLNNHLGTETTHLVVKSPVQVIQINDDNNSAINNNTTKKDRGKPFRQILVAFIANFGTINTGLVFGFSAVVIPQLEAKDSVIPIDENQASWIASLSSASTPLGCILSGYLMDTIGRKLTLILTEIPLIIGWILIASANNVYMIYVGRLFVGLGSGMVGAPARVYTSEVTQPHLRGMLSALASVSISFGVLFQYTLGSFLKWQTLSIVSVFIPIMALITMLFVPETPNYLIARSKHNDALKSLAKLRGSSYNLQNEVQTLTQFTEKNNAKRVTTLKQIISALAEPATLKPFGILFLYFMMYQFSGVNTITFYAVEIFEISGTTMDKYTCTIVLGVVRLLFTILACASLRRCGRRPLTFISGIGCGTTMLGLGIYMYYKTKLLNEDSQQQPLATWFPVACIFLFQITCTVGFLVVPWVMIGEIYPQKVRGIIGGFTTCSAHMFVFTVVKTYPFLRHTLQDHGAFMLYGCISFLGTVFLYFCLPETKGKTLQEIEDYFSGRTKTLNTKKNKKQKNQNLPIHQPPTIKIDKDSNLSP